MKFRTSIALILLINFSSWVGAFLAPKVYNARTRDRCVKRLPAVPDFDLISSSSTLVAEYFFYPTEEIAEASAAAAIADDSGGILNGLGGVVYNLGIAATAILFFAAGGTYLFGNWIMPKAAEELEKECKELNPELWDKYQKLLPPGTTMFQNPELMRKLGAELQPLVEKKAMAQNPELMQNLKDTVIDVKVENKKE